MILCFHLSMLFDSSDYVQPSCVFTNLLVIHLGFSFAAWKAYGYGIVIFLPARFGFVANSLFLKNFNLSKLLRMLQKIRFTVTTFLVVLSFRVRLLYILFSWIRKRHLGIPTSPLLCCPNTMPLERGVEAMDSAWTVDSFEASLLGFSACPAFMAVLWIARTNKY